VTDEFKLFWVRQWFFHCQRGCTPDYVIPRGAATGWEGLREGEVGKFPTMIVLPLGRERDRGGDQLCGTPCKAQATPLLLNGAIANPCTSNLWPAGHKLRLSMSMHEQRNTTSSAACMSHRLCTQLAIHACTDSGQHHGGAATGTPCVLFVP
jgi:hypothetical protein